MHCTQTVLQGVRENTGIGDEVLERISIAMDGGVGIGGGAYGALVGAVLAINLLLGSNLRDEAMPRAYYTFFNGLTFLRSDKPEEIPDPFNVGKLLVRDFKKVAGSIDCAEITQRGFEDRHDSQAYLRSSDKCHELIDTATDLATSAIERYGSQM
jgi:hypothetical protein